jgi:hypothetical protein
VLTIDGERLNPLSVDDLQYYEARFGDVLAFL